MASFSFLAVLLILGYSNSGLGAKRPDNVVDSRKDVGDILYFGWFLDRTTASSLQKYTTEVFAELFYGVPAVSEFMSQVDPELDPFSYFVKPVDPNTGSFDPYYHVTAKFCGDADCSDYYNRAKDSLETVFQTNLIGFFFTKGTFGVRVNLTAEQQVLFDMAEERSVISSYTTRSNKSDFPGISFIRQPENFHPSTSRAHITLGCGPGVDAVQTGFDLLDVISYEADGVSYETVTLPDIGTLRIYHAENITKTAFVLYPDFALLVDGTFKAYDKNSSSSSNPALFSFLMITFSFLRFIW